MGLTPKNRKVVALKEKRVPNHFQQHVANKVDSNCI